jgi:hypothetical protein
VNQRKTALGSKSKLDVTGILMTVLGPSMLLIPFMAFILVYLEYDIGYQLFPLSYSNYPVVLAFRCILKFWALLESIICIACSHILLITLIFHTKSIFENLNVYKKPPFMGFPVVDAAALNKQTTNKRQASLSTPTAVVLGKLEEIQIFSLTRYFFSVVNQHFDTMVLFTLFPGSLIDVTLSFAVLTLHGKIPLMMYAYFCFTDVIVKTIIMAELPQAGKSYVASEETLKRWKVTCRSRKALPYKKVAAWKGVGYTMGGFFTFRRGTTATFMEAVMGYTINSILSLS